jgi:GT2 family glycosyltransferase
MKWLPKLLLSIPKMYRIIFIDNNSSDDTVSFLKQQNGNSSLITNNANLGFGAANNLGISIAMESGDDYVFLLNQDAYLIGDPIRDLILAHQSMPEYGILSPIHLDGTEASLDGNFGKYLQNVNNNKLLSDLVIKKPISDVYPVTFVNAAAWLISKDCIDKVGVFDSLFYHYGEDDNYCQRVLFHQFKIGIVPKAYVVHDRDSRKVVKLSEKQKLSKILLKHKIIAADINNENGVTYLKERIIKLPFVILKGLLTFSFVNMRLRIKEVVNLVKLTGPVKTSRGSSMTPYSNTTNTTNTTNNAK